jgi:hypothetical protein
MTTLREAARLVAAVLDEKQQSDRAAAIRAGLGTVAWYMPDILNMEYGPLALGTHTQASGAVVTESVVIDGGIIYLETRGISACQRQSVWSLLTGIRLGEDGEGEAGGSDLTRSPQRIRPPSRGHGQILRLGHDLNV